MAFKIKKGKPRELTTSSPATKTSYQRRGMYSSLKIDGFRAFDELLLDDLSSINLFCGRNNCGKTSILEAVYAHASGLNFVPFQGQVVIKRTNNTLSGGLDAGEKLLSLFRNKSSFPCSFTIAGGITTDKLTHTLTNRFFPSSSLADLDPRGLGQYSSSAPVQPETAEQLEIAQPADGDSKRSIQLQTTFLGKWQAQLTGEKLREISLEFPLTRVATIEPFKLAVWSDVLSHRDPDSDVRVFSYLKRYDILEAFTEEMRNVFPEIKRVDVIPYPDASQGPVTVYTMDGRIIPLYAFGDGMRRWFYLLGHLTVYKNAIHCIEEIDSTFHSSAHAELSRLLVNYSERYNNQLFMTSQH